MYTDLRVGAIHLVATNLVPRWPLGRGRSRDGLADQGDEGVVIDGLDQVMVEAPFPGAEAIVVLAVAGDGDDHGVRNPSRRSRRAT